MKINAGDQSFELNIRSTAKRLGITPKEVKEISKKGDQALQILEDKAKIRQKALRKYEEIVKQYEPTRGELLHKEVGRIGLTPETLLKVIQKGITISENKAGFKDQKIQVGRYTFFATKDFEKLHLVKGRLGSGSFGTVFKTIQLASPEVKALKVSSKDKNAIRDLENEFNVLSELNKEESCDGIPPTPSKITKISYKNCGSSFCDMTLMSSDLATSKSSKSSFQRLKANDRLELCLQLLRGLEHMHKKGYNHGDIKPANCLVKSKADGTPEKFFIADYGGT